MSHAGRGRRGRGAAAVAAQLESEPPVHELYGVHGRRFIAVVVVTAVVSGRLRAVARGPTTATAAAGHLHPTRPRVPVTGREHGHGAEAGEQVRAAFLAVRGLVRPLSARRRFPDVVVVAAAVVAGVREVGRDRHQPESGPSCENETKSDNNNTRVRFGVVPLPRCNIIGGYDGQGGGVRVEFDCYNSLVTFFSFHKCYNVKTFKTTVKRRIRGHFFFQIDEKLLISRKT